MKVNGIDVSQYGVQQWNIQREFSKIENESEWTAGAAAPIMLTGTAGFKNLKVSVMIRGSTRKEIWEKSGNFIAKLLKPCEYQLDGFDTFFYGYLKNASQVETSLNRWHKATMELVGYEYGKEVVNSFTAKAMNIQNRGNIITPAIVEITPVINLASVVLTGLVRDEITGETKSIKVKNLNNGKKIT